MREIWGSWDFRYQVCSLETKRYRMLLIQLVVNIVLASHEILEVWLVMLLRFGEFVGFCYSTLISDIIIQSIKLIVSKVT